jgi:hypothetical protein
LVTNAEAPEAPKPTRAEIAERISVLREDAARASRTLLTGDANGRMRRNLLFVLTAAGIIVGSQLALLPLFLLALTDMLVVE